jgi:hypothetical protein
VDGLVSTPATPNHAAVRNTVPRLPGSRKESAPPDAAGGGQSCRQRSESGRPNTSDTGDVLSRRKNGKIAACRPVLKRNLARFGILNER